MESHQESLHYESDLATMWFDERGILCLRHKKNVNRTLEKGMKTVEVIRQISNNRKVCLYYDLSECSLIMMDVRGKEYMARMAPVICKAVAVLAVSTLQKVAPTIFLNTMGQPVPIKIFTVEEEAKEWLSQYL